MTYKNIHLAIALWFTTIGIALAQVPKPADEQKKPIAIMNATAHLGNGQVIENSIITFDKGKITIVADARLVRVDLTTYEVIDASGKHVYPGLILPNSALGLVEVEAVRATRDNSEVGDINPNVRSLIAYTAESELVPTLRFNGILLAQTTPGGGRISGTSSVVELDGWNWEDAAYRTDDGVHLNWMSLYQSPKWWLGETQMKKNEKYDEQVLELENFFKDVQSYASSTVKTANLKLEAMKGLLDGSKTLYISVFYAKDILAAVQFAQAQGVKKIVLKGAEQAYMVKEFLKDNRIPVILADVHRLPSNADEDIDMPYKLPALLQQAGVLVALGYEGLHNSRNLPFFAGTAATYGLNKEEALQMITLNAAKILGIDTTSGSLEVGKDAHIVISTGDLLDMRTNNVETAFISGRKLNLSGKQQQLYELYKNKYEQK